MPLRPGVSDTIALRTALGVLAVGLAACGGSGGPAAPTPTQPTASYEYSLTGSATDVTRATTAGYVLVGGGTDVDEAMRWLIARAGGGDIVVLRATGTNAYNPYIADLGIVNSVATIVTRTADAASDAVVLDKVRRAEALFIAGGDQSDYVRLWKGTPLADAIRAAAARGVPIGGTSAGLAILGQFVYSALNASAVSSSALLDPYGTSITLDRTFLDLAGLDGVLTDSHFGARDRMGRLVTFLARVVQDGWAAEGRGIGVDERTAVLVDASGAATVVGAGAAYFLRASAPAMCQARMPLQITNVAVYRGVAGTTFNLRTWSGPTGTTYRLSAANGTLSSDQIGGVIY